MGGAGQADAGAAHLGARAGRAWPGPRGWLGMRNLLSLGPQVSKGPRSEGGSGGGAGTGAASLGAVPAQSQGGDKTPGAAALQVPLSMEFSRQDARNGLQFPIPVMYVCVLSHFSRV